MPGIGDFDAGNDPIATGHSIRRPIQRGGHTEILRAAM
jgi:hypothetical protein